MCIDVHLGRIDRKVIDVPKVPSQAKLRVNFSHLRHCALASKVGASGSSLCEREARGRVGNASASSRLLLAFSHYERNMENPHAERQAVLLERIVKNTVSKIDHSRCSLL